MNQTKSNPDDLAFQVKILVLKSLHFLFSKLGKKLQARELEMDTINGKLRKSEFEQKRLQKDLETALAKNTELEDSTLELEKRLAVLNEEMQELVFENQRLSKFKEREEDPEVSFEDLLNKCKELLQEKETLEAELQKFKEVLIQTVMEKDREIEELSKSASPEMLEGLLKEREGLYSENEELKTRLLQMEVEFEAERTEKEEIRRLIDQEVVIGEKYREQLDRNKAHEASLIEELRRSDEKIQQLEKKEKTFETQLHEKNAEIFSLKKVVAAKEAQNLQSSSSEEIERCTTKYEKQIEELRRDTEVIELKLKKQVTEHESESSEMIKKLEIVEKEKVKLQENANALKIRIEALESQLERESKDFEEKMKEKEETLLDLKEKLERENRELKDELEQNTKRHRYMIPSAANLLNLKDDLEVFNGYLAGSEKLMHLNLNLPAHSTFKIPSVHRLPSCNRISIDESDTKFLREENTALREENGRLKNELVSVKKELETIREDEIAGWEKELNKEKELFQSYKQEKDQFSSRLTEKNLELEQKNHELEEKVKSLSSEITDIRLKQTQKVQAMELSHSKELSSTQELYKATKTQLETFEELKRDKSRLESDLKKQRDSFQQEKEFLENEVKVAESMAVSAKIMFAEVSMDKDFFQFKYQQALKEAKKRGLDLKV